MIAAVVAFGWATGTQESAAAEGAPDPITILSGGWWGTDYTTRPSTAIFEEKTNTEITVIATGWGNEILQKQAAMLAAGDYPELMFVDGNDELRFAQSGLLVALNDHWDTYTTIRDHRPMSAWEIMKHPDGNIYCLPNMAQYMDGTPFTSSSMLIYRKDWLEQFGMDVPTTLDEYWDAAEAMSLEDPDGNGRDDTYAIGGEVGSFGIGSTFDHIFGAYGTNPLMWMRDIDGSIVHGSVMEGSKQALIYLNRMWDAGLIDPDTPTDVRDRVLQKQIDGVYGAWYFFGHMLAEGHGEGWREAFLEKNPDGDWVAGKVLTAPGYEEVAIGGKSGSLRGWHKTSAVTRSENWEAGLRLMNYMVSKEGMLLRSYGIQGEHWDYKDDGTIQEYTTPEEKAEFGIWLAAIPVNLISVRASWDPSYLEVLKEWEDYRVKDQVDYFLIPEIGEYNAELEEFVSDQFLKMIVGEIEIDGGFEEFVEQFYDRGGRELTDALNEAAMMQQ
jgi:putative aldouronate transport system substrate-binding protein